VGVDHGDDGHSMQPRVARKPPRFVGNPQPRREATDLASAGRRLVRGAGPARPTIHSPVEVPKLEPQAIPPPGNIDRQFKTGDRRVRASAAGGPKRVVVDGLLPWHVTWGSSRGSVRSTRRDAPKVNIEIYGDLIAAMRKRPLLTISPRGIGFGNDKADSAVGGAVAFGTRSTANRVAWSASSVEPKRASISACPSSARTNEITSRGTPQHVPRRPVSSVMDPTDCSGPRHTVGVFLPADFTCPAKVNEHGNGRRIRASASATDPRNEALRAR